MPCFCEDLLDDVRVKYDLILELVNTVLGLLSPTIIQPERRDAIGIYEGIQYAFPRKPKGDLKGKLSKADSMIIDFIVSITTSGILE